MRNSKSDHVADSQNVTSPKIRVLIVQLLNKRTNERVLLSLVAPISEDGGKLNIE
jgi:hypothetical protein